MIMVGLVREEERVKPFKEREIDAKPQRRIAASGIRQLS